MARDDELEKAAEQAVAALTEAFADLGEDAAWRAARAMIHRAVHAAAKSGQVDYCVVATYLAEMVGHAHGLMHEQSGAKDSHKDRMH